MRKRNTSEYNDIANDLWFSISFYPERAAENNALFVVKDMQDAYAIDKESGCPVWFNTDDREKLKNCKTFFDDFELAYLLIPSEVDRNNISDMMTDLFPNVQQYIVTDYHGYNSFRDYYDDTGSKGLDNLVVSAKPKPAYGIVELADVEPKVSVPSVNSGIGELDKAINGCGMGQLSIWTGTRGSGKSTLASQLLLEAVNQGHKVCAYSGELPNWQFQSWAFQQAAGRNNVMRQINPNTGAEYYMVADDVKKRIKEWWRGNFYLYDNNIANANDADSIIRVLELAAHRYGCKVFLADNLMTAQFKDERDFYREQSNFVGRLAAFAKNNNVHVHLVAHPRKAGDKPLIADDVGGSGDITNRADNVFSLKRIDDESAGFDAGLTILKNRDYGATGKIKLLYDVASRRYYPLDGSPNNHYGWDNLLTDIDLPLVENDLPF